MQSAAATAVSDVLKLIVFSVAGASRNVPLTVGERRNKQALGPRALDA